MLSQAMRNASRSILLSQRRTFLTRTSPLLKDLPYHLVMGLPALSPTMETGALAEWYVKEGDKFSAGDAIAKIETDKASIDFEAQDDAYVAKILVDAGNGNDIKCGTPILITVDDEADVAAFKDYVLPVAAVEEPAAAPATPTTKVDEPVKAAPAPIAPEPAKVIAAPAPPPSAPVAASVAPSSIPPPATRSTPRPTINPSSALLKTLGRSQQAYLDQYGSTGQLPV